MIAAAARRSVRITTVAAGVAAIASAASPAFAQDISINFGGGAGLVMMAQPIYDCMDAVLEGKTAHRILMTPRGRTLNQKIARELSEQDHLVLLCGHYEGVDERVMNIIDDTPIPHNGCRPPKKRRV